MAIYKYGSKIKDIYHFGHKVAKAYHYGTLVYPDSEPEPGVGLLYATDLGMGGPLALGVSGAAQTIEIIEKIDIDTQEIISTEINNSNLVHSVIIPDLRQPYSESFEDYSDGYPSTMVVDYLPNLEGSSTEYGIGRVFYSVLGGEKKYAYTVGGNVNLLSNREVPSGTFGGGSSGVDYTYELVRVYGFNENAVGNNTNTSPGEWQNYSTFTWFIGDQEEEDAPDKFTQGIDIQTTYNGGGVDVHVLENDINQGSEYDLDLRHGGSIIPISHFGSEGTQEEGLFYTDVIRYNTNNWQGTYSDPQLNIALSLHRYYSEELYNKYLTVSAIKRTSIMVRRMDGIEEIIEKNGEIAVRLSDSIYYYPEEGIGIGEIKVDVDGNPYDLRDYIPGKM